MPLTLTVRAFKAAKALQKEMGKDCRLIERHHSLVLSIALLAAGPAFADESAQSLLSCSAHFNARAEWLEEFRQNPVTVETMRAYSDMLLDAYRDAIGPMDWGMSTGLSDLGRLPTAEESRVEKTTQAMTAFALLGYGNGPLPLCMEDEECQRCTVLLRRTAKR